MLSEMKFKYSTNEIISLLDRKYGLGKLERLLFTNWFNIFLTIYINFRSFPFKQAFRLPIFVYGRPRIYGLSGNMFMTCKKISPGMIKFNYVMPGAPNSTSGISELYNEGLILFNGSGEIGTGTKIRVAFRAKLKVGKRFKITDQCNIGCLNSIEIGDDSWIVHRTQVCDSNYHYVENLNTNEIPYIKSKSISIGKRCWICNSCDITGGAIVPSGTIVASHSLVSKDYSSLPPFSIIGGIPAKLISTGVRWIKSGPLEREIINYYELNPEGCFINSHPVEFDIEE